MKSMQNEVIIKLTKKLHELIRDSASGLVPAELKTDKSFITEIDLFVSDLVKQTLSTHPNYSCYNFFCEEDYNSYVFPCAILDPIDGTRELVRGRPECAVSLALMRSPLISDPSNFAWLYNPFSGFNLDTEIPFVPTSDKSIHKILTFVSRTEFHKGLYDKYLTNTQIQITPRGSIAFKLGLLASGACDFIITLLPKNVWDIAAGTILCAQRGIFLYENGKRITELDRQNYSGVLIWAPDLLAPILLKTFESEFNKEKN